MDVICSFYYSYVRSHHGSVFHFIGINLLLLSICWATCFVTKVIFNCVSIDWDPNGCGPIWMNPMKNSIPIWTHVFPCTDNLQCRGDWFMPLLCFCNQQWVKMRIAVPPIQNTWILFFHPCEGKTIDFSFSFYLICPKLLTFVCQNVPLFLKFFTFLHAHT